MEDTNTLMVDDTDQYALHVVATTKDAPDSTGCSVLLADDNETNQIVIGQQLSRFGCAVNIAKDGKQALSMWKAGTYDLLLADCHMPEMDGYELSRSIRGIEGEGSRIPIIAITADAMDGTASKCLSAGMDGYLTKPMRLREVQEMLDKWLPSNNTIAETSNFVVEQMLSDSIVDPQVLRKLLGIDDFTTLANLYDDFVANGRTIATELRAAHNRGDVTEVGRLAHKLTSSARTIGANSLADCCIALEVAGLSADPHAATQHMPAFEDLFEQVCNWVDEQAHSEAVG